MSQFTDTLSNLLKNNNITLYALARDTGIERTLLTKIINGKRSLTIENFRRILESLQILESDSRMLKELYIDEYYRAEKFKKNLDRLSLFSNAPASSDDYAPVKVSLNSDIDTVRFHSRRELINLIEAICDGKSERIYLNFDFDDLFDIISKYVSYFTDIDFKMIIPFSEYDAEDFLEKTLKYSDTFLPIRYQTGNAELDPFPCFMVTDEYVLLTDLNFKKGVLVKNRLAADTYAEKFLEAFEKATPFISHFTDILDLRRRSVQDSYLVKFEKDCFSFSNSLSAPLFMTPEMWEQVAKENIPNREFLKSIVYEHYKSINESIHRYTSILYRSTLTQFARGGEIPQLPKNLISPLNLENRIEVLKAMREYFKKEERRFYIFSDIPDFTSSETFCFDVSITSNGTANVDIVKTDSASPDKFVGNTSLFLYGKSICNAAKEFIDIITVSPYCYTQKESFNILDEEIKRLELELDPNSSENPPQIFSDEPWGSEERKN